MEQFVETATDRQESWVSARHLAALELAAKAASFDKFIDLALDGVITRDEAIAAYKEEWCGSL